MEVISKNPPAAPRLASIDMLRGAAALAVVLYHAAHKGVFIYPERAATWYEWLTLGPFSFGYVGVYFFFVISGFCIHLKVAKGLAAGRITKVDFWAFWRRRLRRLYPAYIAALALYLIVAWWVGHINFKAHPVWDITSHLLLIHNLDHRTVFSLNGVFWTLALEEQLYLAYFLVLWLRQRWSWRQILLCAVLVRVAWLTAAAAIEYLSGWEMVTLESAAANWCIWVLGALAVENYFGYVKLPEWCYRWRWALALASCGAVLAYGNYWMQETGRFAWGAKLVLQPLWGLASFIVINRIVRDEAQRSASVTPARWRKALLGIGLISYSLYLTHELVFHLEPHRAWLSVPLALAVAWVFFQLFEKPFLTAPPIAVTPPPKPTPAPLGTPATVLE